MKRNSTTLVIAICLVFAVLIAWMLTRGTEWLARSPTVANNQASPSGAPTAFPAPPTANFKKQATCRTTPGGGQPAAPHAECAFIAAHIPVLPSQTSDAVRTDHPAVSLGLEPGMDVPASVRDLKPLPAVVTQTYPQLEGSRYFLAGEDIVVVGRDKRVAFVIDVKVRP